MNVTPVRLMRHPFRPPEGKTCPTWIRAIQLLCALLPWVPLPGVVPAGLADEFYVDPTHGSDTNPGTKDRPLQTLRAALRLVHVRAQKGQRSDRIVLRGGTYRIGETLDPGRALYFVDLRGTPEHYAEITAMPAAPGAQGAVQRKSGAWYEQVVIDDSSVVEGLWTRLSEDPKIWKLRVPYPKSRWGKTPLHRLLGSASERLNFAPAMMLQDGLPLEWVRSWKEITRPGQRYFDADANTLYVRPYGDVDPNTAVFRTWPAYANQKRGRRVFGGILEYARIRGLEFHLCLGLLQMPKRDIFVDKQRIVPRASHVIWEDLDTYYCLNHWMTQSPHVDHFTIRNNRFHYSSREIVQLAGPGHVIEYNEVLYPHSRWSPYNLVSLFNFRVMPGVIFRGNVIYGNGLTPKPNKGGVALMFEVYRKHTGDSGEVTRFGGALIEGNLFYTHEKTVMSLGKGAAALKDVKIRRNVFVGCRPQHGGVISIPNAQVNLAINHNVFYDCKHAIMVATPGKHTTALLGGRVPSSISISHNIFDHCIDPLSQRLEKARNPKDRILITKNLFFHAGPPVGEDAIVGKDPLFLDPERFDFRLHEKSPAVQAGPDIGAYERGEPVPTGMDWWRYTKTYFTTIKDRPVRLQHPPGARQPTVKGGGGQAGTAVRNITGAPAPHHPAPGSP